MKKKQRKNRTTKIQEWLAPEKLVLLEGWRRDGLSLEQIANNIGIRRETLYVWCKKEPNINNAIKKGDEVAIYEIENALYKSAIGHYAEEVEITETEKNGDKIVTKSKRKKYIPPNVAAQIFILKNRRNMKWRDNPDIVDNDNIADDGFIDAIKGTAAEDWSENGEDKNE